MYIKNIKLQNYRNYENLDLDLGRKTTVLIGKNGAGKTNMISALKQSLSFIFSKGNDICQKDFIADSIQKIKTFDTTDARRPMLADGSQSQSGAWPVCIQTTIDIDETAPLCVKFERNSLSTGMRELYYKDSIHYWEHYRDLADLPVLAFFSDSYPHEKPTIGKKIQDLLNSEFGISKPAGYYNWDDQRDSSVVWLQYFTMQWKNYKYGHSSNNEEEYVNVIRDCMIRFSQPLENADANYDFEVEDVSVIARGKNEVVVLRFKNGIVADFESLPAGYRRAFSMAFDLANRAFLLNNNCNPEGICFIDEIDLHLHPSLAQEVLERMQKTFDRLQFIVSTHSPLVLSNFKRDEQNIVYKLFKTSEMKTEFSLLDYTYGLDYQSLLDDVMESPVRNSLLEQLLKAYHYWEAAGKEAFKQQILKQIVELVGDNSKIVKELKQ